MSDPSDARARPGSPADRSPVKAIGLTAAGSSVLSLLMGNADWISDMLAAGQFLPPARPLMYMWASALAPIVHLFYLIWMKRLSTIAGAKE